MTTEAPAAQDTRTIRDAAAPLVANLTGAHASRTCLKCGSRTSLSMCMTCWSRDLAPADRTRQV